MFRTALLTLFSVLSVYAFSEQATIENLETEQVFPREISFKNADNTYHLEATGTSIRERGGFIDVYTIASYVEKGKDLGKFPPFDTIMQPDKAKQLTMRWLLNLSAKKVQNGFDRALGQVFEPEQIKGYQKEIALYKSFFNKKFRIGEETIVRSLPGGSIVVIVEGKEAGRIENATFALGLWSVWFGPNSVVDRDEMVSELAPR